MANRNVAAVEKWAVIAPVAAATAIVQGTRYILTSNKLVAQTNQNTDWFCVADFANPDVLANTVTKGRVYGTGNIVYALLKSGDSAAFNDALYCEGVGQECTVTSTSRKLFGYCRELASVTGDGSRYIKVEIRPTQTGAP